MSSLADEISLLNQAAKDEQTSRYLAVACFVALCYDVLLTLPEEFSLIWRAKRTSGKILFLLTRYPIVLESIVWLVYMLDINAPPRFCQGVTFMDAWATLAFIVPVQIIIVLRTIALWERRRIVIALLLVSLLAADIVMTVSVGLVSASIIYKPNPLIQPVFGCESNLELSNTSKTIPAWAAVMAFDTIIFFLTLLRACRIRKFGRNTLLTVLVRDGFLYYAVMLLISAANLALYIGLPPSRRGLQSSFLPVLRGSMAIIGARLVLNVRGVLMEGSNPVSHLTTMAFQKPVRNGLALGGETLSSQTQTQSFPALVMVGPVDTEMSQAIEEVQIDAPDGVHSV